MKMVLVFDTEDWDGTRNSMKLAQRFFKIHQASFESDSGRVLLAKIPMIKLVRQVARDVQSNKLNSGLRECKNYVEDRWLDWQSWSDCPHFQTGYTVCASGGKAPPTPTKEVSMLDLPPTTPFDRTADNLTAIVLAITTHQTIETEKDTVDPEMVETALTLFSMTQTPAEA